MGVRLECDRCDRTVTYDMDADTFDSIVDVMPETEIEPGVIMLRCTAWPADAQALALVLQDDPVPSGYVNAGGSGW